MTKLHILPLILLLTSITVISCHKRIYYLYQTESQHDHLTLEALKQNRENHPVHKIDWYPYITIKATNSTAKSSKRLTIQP